MTSPDGTPQAGQGACGLPAVSAGTAAGQAPSAFFRLNERLRHGIVHTLGWRELRPVQEMALEALLDGRNALVLAPTAGGKTEAALLPTLDLLMRRPSRGVGALFLSPLRALLNNQQPRVELLSRLAGLTCFKWHGDVGADRKKRFLADPADVLMITPESLEVLFLTARVPKAELLGDVRVVIVDEIHAFAGDDRGDHLVALLERLRGYTSADFQRVGLSATVGNPEELLEWLQGGSTRPGVVVRPPKEASSRLVEFHPLAEGEDAAPRAVALARGRKSLFFAESRGRVERFKTALEDFGVLTFAHHASLSRELREDAERAFRQGSSCCIVCTSTMELGLDVGHLDLVLQLNAPATVSAFLQRLGRTGRRPGTKARLAFLTDDGDSFLQACALVRLALRGWVEPVAPTRRSLPVYLHQVLARILEHSGLGRRALVEGAGHPYGFADLSPAERETVLDHLLATGILDRADSLLILGPTGEKNFGYANFRELYSVFDTPAQLRVLTTANQEIGTLETWFARALGEPFVFVLGGRAWVTVHCDWERAVLTVTPAPRGRFPSWMGSPVLVSREVCQEIRALLLDTGPAGFLAEAPARVLDRLRRERAQLLRPARLVLQRRGDTVWLHTYAGGRVNQVLGLLLEERAGLEANLDNLAIRSDLPATGPWWSAWEPVLAEAAAGLSQDTLQRLVARLPRGRLSKFQPYLPPAMEARWLAERTLDAEGARDVTAQGWRTLG